MAGAGASPIVVIPLGNRSMGDDGVGPAVLDLLAADEGTAFAVREPRDAMGMVACWEGASTTIVVDAAQSGAKPGTIHRIEHADGVVPKDAGRMSSHGMGLAEALALSEALGRTPPRLVVYAVEAASFEPETPLTPAVAASVPAVAAQIRAEIEGAR